MSNLDSITRFLEGQGLTVAQTAGVEGNLAVESSLNPKALNKKEGAIGIAQWEGGRRTALQQYAASTGGSETDLGTQLGFMWSELQGSNNAAYRALLSTTTPAEAATVWDQQYERSAGTSRQQRIDDANAIAAGKDPTGGGGIGSGISQAAGQAGSAISSAASALNPFSGWQTSALDIGLKIAAVAACGALLIVGAKQTVNTGA